MSLLSFLLNTLVFILLFNWSYIQKRRVNPDCPRKPIARSLIFPVALGIAYTLLVDMYKGIFFYQLFLFLIVGLVLFWKLYTPKKNGN